MWLFNQVYFLKPSKLFYKYKFAILFYTSLLITKKNDKSYLESWLSKLLRWHKNRISKFKSIEMTNIYQNMQ